MYLVLFKEISNKEHYNLFQSIYDALTGCYIHCELVFENDFTFDALVISARTHNCAPIFKKNRKFVHPDRRFKYKFYKFVDIPFDKEASIKQRCIDIANEKKYIMSYDRMLLSVLPKELLTFRDFFIDNVLDSDNSSGTKASKSLTFEKQKNKKQNSKPTYCVEIIRKVFHNELDNKWPENMTPMDFAEYLLKEKRVEVDILDEKKIKYGSKKKKNMTEDGDIEEQKEKGIKDDDDDEEDDDDDEDSDYTGYYSDCGMDENGGEVDKKDVQKDKKYDKKRKTNKKQNKNITETFQMSFHFTPSELKAKDFQDYV